MSRNINVNPAHYKVAGRERQGEAINQELQRQQFTEQQAANERWQARQQDATPWEHAPAPSAEPDTPKRTRRASVPNERPRPIDALSQPNRRHENAAPRGDRRQTRATSKRR
jgi:hypothetical protein